MVPLFQNMIPGFLVLDTTEVYPRNREAVSQKMEAVVATVTKPNISDTSTLHQVWTEAVATVTDPNFW